ncbi:MAG: hypothetical protein P8X96_20540 [Desulfobacteraceae bacterium]|jgi:hypothetical protein
MVRKTISILVYILGGFFVYTVCLLAFVDDPEIGAYKFAIMGGFSIPAFIFLIVGAAICRFQNWKFSMGIVLLSVSGFNLLGFITVICILFTPEFMENFPSNPFTFFGGYVSGLSVMLILAGLGGLLIKTNKHKISESGASPDNGDLGSGDA